MLESTVGSKIYTKNSYTAYKTTTGDKKSSLVHALARIFCSECGLKLRENVLENKNGPIFVTYLATGCPLLVVKRA